MCVEDGGDVMVWLRERREAEAGFYAGTALANVWVWPGFGPAFLAGADHDDSTAAAPLGPCRRNTGASRHLPTLHGKGTSMHLWNS